MRDTCRQQDKTEVIVGVEPTGHYWFTLGEHLKHQGHKIGNSQPLSCQTNQGSQVIKNIMFYIKDFDEFKELSDIIVANRLSDEIKDVIDKVYTRDLFSRE